MGKYPRMGIDWRRSMKGVTINDAHLLVAANMPKETPQMTEAINVMPMREIVLRVYSGRFLISG